MLNEKQFGKLEDKLAELACKNPDEKLPTTRKAIFEKYSTQILELSKKGYTAEHIKDVMEDFGIKMTASTVQQYIRGINRAGGTSA